MNFLINIIIHLNLLNNDDKYRNCNYIIKRKRNCKFSEIFHRYIINWYVYNIIYEKLNFGKILYSINFEEINEMMKNNFDNLIYIFRLFIYLRMINYNNQ